MSTAVLISGQMRSFSSCVQNLNWMVFSKLNDPYFFISCADDAQASDAYLLEAYFPKRVFVEIVKQPDDLPEPPFSLAAHAPYSPTPNHPSVVKSILRQLWHYRRVWDFHKSFADLGTAKFTTYVRCRPDLFFHSFTYPIIPCFGIGADSFVGPWKSCCGGVNDRFSIMGYNAAAAYFTAFDHLNELLDAGCPLHPESIQKAALGLACCRISNTLLAEFTCLRLPGAGRHVELVEYPGELAALLACSR